MKRRDKKFISMITAMALSTSMLLNYSPLIAKGGVCEGDLEELLRKNIESYEQKSLDCSKSNLYKNDALDENGSGEKDLEEEIRVIVQLKEAPAIDTQDGREYTDSAKENEQEIKNSQLKVIEEAERITGKEVRRNFGYLVNGFSINAKRKHIEELDKIDGVKCVTEVRSYKTDMSYAKQITGATSVWDELNIKGEGTVVSIIDTGIDYRHKDLQEIASDTTKLKKDEITKDINKLGYGQYFSEKIPFGYNYADGNTNVIDTGSMHGMHVAGIVAANGKKTAEGEIDGIQGIAPQAQLFAMKVFTNNPETSSAYDDDIIAAIEDSVKLGADVINMSLGSNAGFTDPDDPENQAVQRATDAGVICVISAGNSATSTQQDTSSSQPANLLGLKDTSTIGSPSTASSSLSVASMENTHITGSAAIFKDSNGSIVSKMQYVSPAMKYINPMNGKFEIVDCGFGKPDELKELDLTGKIALVKRGSITFQEKYENCIAKGAAGVIIYNNESGGNSTISMAVENVKKPLISIGNSDGAKLLDLIKNGDGVFEVDLKSSIMSIENGDVQDMSQYTSWGATSDLEFKPEVTAPGGDIYSLANNDSYQSMSGTSMAAPNTAGTEALIMQAIKKRYPKLSGSELVGFVKNTAMNTAKPMIDKYDTTNSIPYSPRRQGAGLIRVKDAINNNVIIKYKDGKGAVALKEVGNKTTFQLELTNYGTKAVTYNLKDEKVYGEDVVSNLIHEVVLENSVAKFDKTSVTVEPGKTATVNVTLNISDSEKTERFVEGYLNFASTDETAPSLSVPFMGFYGDWSKEKIIDVPNFKNTNESIIGVTGLVDKQKHALYGQYVENRQTYIDNDKVAFSPNADGFKDQVLPAVYMLRNAKDLKVEVLDSNGNVVREIFNYTNVRKNLLENGLSPKYLSGATWDGTLYDKVTGKYVKAPEGQYTVRLKSKLELNNSKEQILDLPVKIDTTAPSVNIKGVEKVSDGKFKLTWEAQDNDGGSTVMPVCAIAVNGKTINLKAEDVKVANGQYSTDIPFVDGEVNTISVAVSDYAGNSAIAEKKERAVNLKDIALSGLSDGMVIANKDLKEGKFILNGTAGDNLGKLIVNDKDVKFEDNYFETAVEVAEGENKIKVYAEDKQGKEVYNQEFNVICDTTNPEVKVQQNITNVQPYYVTEDAELALDLQVIDKTKCTVTLNNITDKNNEATSVELNDEGKGKGKIRLLNGLNTIELVVVDKGGNKTTNKYIVVKGDSAEELSVGIDNVAVAHYINKTNLKDGVYVVKGHVSKKVDYLKINGQDVSINDDLTFTYNLKVKEGKNILNIYAKDPYGNVVADYSYKVFYDETAPKVELNDFVFRPDNRIYVNNPNFELKGILKENLYGYYLFINGDLLKSEDYNPAKVNDGLVNKFSKAIKLVDGENTIKIEAQDMNSNVFKDDLKIVLDTVAPNKPKFTLSNTKPTLTATEVNNQPVYVTIDSDEEQLDRIEYSTDGVNYVKYTGEFVVGTSTKVYARVIDYAGNVSELAEVEVNVDTTKPEVTLNGVIDGQTYYEPVTLNAEADDKDANITILVNGKEYRGEALDIEGEYTVEAYAVNEAGNKSDIVKKTFKLAQNCIESTDGDMKVLKHNNIRPFGDNYLFKSNTSDNVTLRANDTEKGAVVVTPNTVVTMLKDIVKANSKDYLDYTQKVYEDKELLKSLNSIGKVFEMTLNNGNNVIDLGDEQITVSFKLDKTQLDGKDTSKLKAYIYDEADNEWKELSGEFDNITSTFTFKTNKLGKFTIAQKNIGSGSPAGNAVNNDLSASAANDKKAVKSKIAKSAKTGDNIALAGAVAVMAAVAGAITLVTGRKKRK